MDKYNQSHKKDLTAYQALENIDKEVRQSAKELIHLFCRLSRSAGFRVIGLHLMHIQTGTTVNVHQQSKEEDHV